MPKSLEALQLKLAELYELKEKAETVDSRKARPDLQQQLFNGAMELLATGSEFAPSLPMLTKKASKNNLIGGSEK